jgi:hypothetical protein
MPPRSGTTWSDEEIAALKRLAEARTPLWKIAVKLKRTEAGIEHKLRAEGLARHGDKPAAATASDRHREA